MESFSFAAVQIFCEQLSLSRPAVFLDADCCFLPYVTKAGQLFLVALHAASVDTVLGPPLSICLHVLCIALSYEYRRVVYITAPPMRRAFSHLTTPGDIGTRTLSL